MRMAVFAAALALSACATATPERIAVPFNPAEAEYSRKPGTATVRGQMFLRRKDGVVVYGAGSEAALIPRVSQSEAAMAASFNGGKIRMEARIFGANLLANEINIEPTLMAYARRTKADGQGNFAFEGIPPGQYYVLGRVTWCVILRYGSCDQQGGDILEAIMVNPTDKAIQVILSGQ